MANYRLRSGAGGAADGTTWANAYTTGSLALASKAVTDVIWVAPDHSEDGGSAVTLTFPSAVGLKMLGVSSNSTDPATALNSTPAAIIGVGAGSNLLTLTGHGYIAAMKFRGGTSVSANCSIALGNSASPVALFFDKCAFELRTTSGSANLYLGATPGSGNDDIFVGIRDSTLKFGATGQSVVCRSGRFHLQNVSFVDSSGSTPSVLIEGTQGCNGSLLWESSDLSAEGFATLFDIAWNAAFDVELRNCKFSGAPALTTGTHSGPGGVRIRVHNCDGFDHQNGFGEASNAGTVVDETTLVRSGGGAVSYRMDSSANSVFPYLPLTMEGRIWNTVTGSAQTLTVPILHDSVTDLDNDEIAVEVHYQGTSGFPLALVAHDAAVDVFATPAAQASDSGASWNTTGVSNPNKQKLEVSFTAQEEGYVYFQVRLFVPSKTVYVDVGGASIA